MGVAKSWKKSLRYGAASIAVGAASAFAGVCAAEPVQFDIEAAPLGDALRDFGTQAGMSVIFSEALVRDHAAPALRGAYEPDEALRRLLAGSNLEFVVGPNDNLIIREAKTTSIKTSAQLATPDQEREEEPVVDALSDEPDAARPEETEPQLRAERVTVTGTSIRGIAPESSPLQMYSRDDILKSGVTTTEQFIRTLPQNFSGGSTEFAADGFPNDDNASRNNTYGTSANLRGLGSDGTLVLLNGNRLAPTSAIGDFVDLSLIPVSALERIDVLTDGASSIYGGDAVAGVINFVLRDDFEGAETAVRFGSDSGGDVEEFRLNQTLGTNWATGNIIGSYEYFSRDNLTLANRPDIPAPLATNGLPLTTLDSFDLLPKHKRNSAVVALNQAVSRDLALSAYGLYSKRETSRSSATNAASQFIRDADLDSEGITVNAGVDYELPADWSASVDATYSQIRNDSTTRNSVNDDLDVTATESDVWAFDALATGGLFNLPGGRVKIAFGGQYREESFSFSRPLEPDDDLARRADRRISAAFGEVQIPLVGAPNAIPGIQRLELNVSGRIDDYSDFGTTSNPKFGILWSPVEELNLRASYSESFTPPSLGRVGDPTYTGNIAPTSFITGLLGLSGQYPTLEASESIILTGVSRDLRPQTSTSYTAGADYHRTFGRHSWEASSSYYRVLFEDRLGTVPVPQNLNALFGPFIAFDDPSAFPPGAVIFFPTDAQVQEILSELSQVAFLLGATGENVGIISNIDVVGNLASTKNEGVDLSVNYTLDTDFGSVSAGFNANYIIDFTRQAATTSPEVDVLNTLYNPVGLQARTQFGITHGNLSGNLFVNYVDGYRTDNTANAADVDSWLTADLRLSYGFSAPSSSLLNDTSLNLSVINLFNESPPTTPTAGGFLIAGYDPANASPLGRFISLEFRKSF